MTIFLKLGWHFRAHWRRYAMAALMLVLVDVLEMLVPWLTGRLIDQVVADSLTPELLLNYALLVAGIGLVVYVLRFLWRYFLFSSSFQLAELLRQRVYLHMTRMAPGFFQQHRTGDLMARATNDITAVEMTAGEGVLSGIDGLVTGVLVLAIMLLTISWQLTLVALLPFPIMAWYFMRLGDRLHAGFTSAQERFSDLNDQVQESVSGIRMIRAFGREQEEDARFLQIADRAAEANMVVAATDSRYDPAILLTVGASFLASMVMGAWQVQQQTLTLGELTSFTMYLGFLIWPMFAYGWLLNIVERGSAAYTRIEALLNTASPVRDCGKVTECPDYSVAFEVAHFSYPGQDLPVLRDVSVALPAGHTLGIVGATGAGKSTLASLLLRFHDHEACQLSIGGVDIRDYTLDTLRGLIAVVPQDPFLFTASIAGNIAMGKPGASREEVMEVARLASVDKDIRGFPDGYDTLVGERGVTLSGGQKQRIAIARALLLDAPVLILDDALSAVDVETERNILGHLRQARAGRTTLILCHRLSAVEQAEQIIVLGRGQVLEQGNHRSLLASGSWYARMFDYQKLEQTVESGR